MKGLLARTPDWVYLLAVLAALLAWNLWPRTAPVPNPEALVGLESVVSFCESAESAAQEEALCADVRYVADWCRTRGRGLCRLDRFYDTLTHLGFNLPPLRNE